MAKIPRKNLADSIKRDMEQKAKKEELADQVIEKLSQPEKKAIPKKETVELSKLTVMIPAELHNKLKVEAVNKQTKIRNLIIDYIRAL